MNQYVAAFRHVEAGDRDKAAAALKELAASASARVVTDQQVAIKTLVDGQLAKLA